MGFVCNKSERSGWGKRLIVNKLEEWLVKGLLEKKVCLKCSRLLDSQTLLIIRLVWPFVSGGGIMANTCA